MTKFQKNPVIMCSRCKSVTLAGMCKVMLPGRLRGGHVKVCKISNKMSSRAWDVEATEASKRACGVSVRWCPSRGLCPVTLGHHVLLPFESSTMLGRCGLGSRTASLLWTQVLLILPAEKGPDDLTTWPWGPLADNLVTKAWRL